MGSVTGISVANFRCIKEVTISPLARINILVGKNDTGKSSFLGVLRALPKSNKLYKSDDDLPEERHYVKEPPRLLLTTEITDEEREKSCCAYLAKVAQNVPQREEILRVFINAGVYRTITWKFEGRPELRLVEITTSHPRNPITSKVLQVGSPEATVKVPEINIVDLHGLQIGEGVDLLSSGRDVLLKDLPGNAPTLIKPHLDSLAKFLDEPRLFLSAHRQASLSSGVQRPTELTQDGKNLTPRIASLQRSAKTKIQDVLTECIPGIGELDTPPQRDNMIELAFHYPHDVVIPAEHSGTGAEQLAMLLTRIFADHRKGHLLFEEPENHLHPGAQERLMAVIRETVKEGWVFITTHSPFILQVADDTSIVAFKKEADGFTVGKSVASKELRGVLDDLGARLGNLALADVVIFVEGINGKDPLEKWINKFPEMGVSAGVHIVCCSFNVSEAANPHFNVEQFREINPNPIFFIDRDEGSSGHDELERKCSDAEILCVRLRDRGRIEDLFTADAIRRALPDMNMKWKYDLETSKTPVEQYEQQTGQEWCKKKNGLVASYMTVEDLRASPDIRRLVEAIKKLLPKPLFRAPGAS